MNLRQLQYVREVARNGFSISKAAKALHTSQPGISQQIIALEQELRFPIFTRDKNRLTGVTSRGHGVVEHAQAALFNVDCVYAIAKATERKTSSQLVIATSHTQARYLLPPALGRFATEHPGCRLDVRHEERANMLNVVLDGLVDFAVTTTTVAPVHDDILMLPCYESRRVVVVPTGHPLLALDQVTLAEVARYDLVTYHEAIPTRRLILDTFARAGVAPTVRLSAADADVIKAYVAHGLGVTVLPEMTIDRRADDNLQAITNAILFPPSVTALMIDRRRVLSLAAIDFIKIFCPAVALSRPLAGT